jgi:hypothetical protein
MKWYFISNIWFLAFKFIPLKFFDFWFFEWKIKEKEKFAGFSNSKVNNCKNSFVNYKHNIYIYFFILLSARISNIKKNEKEIVSKRYAQHHSFFLLLLLLAEKSLQFASILKLISIVRRKYSKELFILLDCWL